MWLKWDMCQRDYNDSQINPHITMQFVNVIQQPAVTPTYQVPVCTIFPNQAYWELRVQGTFQQQYTFHQFPLDCHNVNYQIEDNIYGRSYLIYKKDDLLAQIFGQTFGTAGIKNGTTIPGWEIGTTLLQKEAVANYNTTDFLQAYANTAFSNYRFGVTITRGLDVYTLKVIPPVFFCYLYWIFVISL